MSQIATWEHSPDEVVDFLVSEALVHKAREHEAEMRKKNDEKQKRDAFKKWED